MMKRDLLFPFRVCCCALIFLPLANGKLRFPLLANAEQPANADGALPPFMEDASSSSSSSSSSSAVPPPPPPNVPGNPNNNINNNINPFQSLTVPLLQLYHFLEQIVLYKPPVGIISLWVATRWSTRVIFQRRPQPGSEQALVAKASKLDRHTGRALDLDKYDLEYQKFGGVERVRRRLLCRILQDEQSALYFEDEGNEGGEREGEDDDANFQYNAYSQALRQVLETSFAPGGSHSNFVHQQLTAMAKVEEYQWKLKQFKSSPPSPQNASNLNPQILLLLLNLSHQTAQVRMIDALLRLTRDRLLRTTFRLSRTVKHWQRRVHSHGNIKFKWARRWLTTGLEGDRMRLAFAEAAYAKEIVKLGKVVGLLLARPEDMDDSALEAAVQSTMELQHQQQDTSHQPTTNKQRSSPSSRYNDHHNKSNSPWSPKLSNMAVRFNADGRGKLALQVYEDALDIDANGAMHVLAQDDHREWLQQSETWTKQGRAMLCDILKETVNSSVPTQAALQAQQEMHLLETTWCQAEYNDVQEISICWESMFEKLRELHQYRRVGDGKNIKWKNANFVHWFRQFDLLGIPSALMQIALAHYAHDKLKPHFPKFETFVKESFGVAHEIVTRRFYGPVKDLLTELMYRPTNKLLEGITVEDEEQSLDNMLRDLKFGDGTPEGRHDAILKAMRQYEQDMNSGMLWHSNRLIRLILIQVQQLKTGMLHATDTVDLLFQANRFNIQLLTIIPAIVIVTIGTKLFVRALFTLRVKDIRPMSSVHAEMTEYLNNLESILLLADRSSTSTSDGNNKQKSTTITTTAQQALTDGELGEFVNTLYDYLVLLDYSSPQPFPSWQCDGIHQSVTEFLHSMNRLTLDDQVKLIDQVKRKHTELAKHL